MKTFTASEMRHFKLFQKRKGENVLEGVWDAMVGNLNFNNLTTVVTAGLNSHINLPINPLRMITIAAETARYNSRFPEFQMYLKFPCP